MNIKKVAIIGAAITAITATSVYAGRVIDHSAKIEFWNQYESSINGTVPGVRVTHGGTSTIYQVGTAPGLTATIVYDDTGKKQVAWASEFLGIEVDALKCSGGGRDGNGGGGGGSFIDC